MASIAPPQTPPTDPSSSMATAISAGTVLHGHGLQRRLSARRGSVCASDPYNQHNELNHHHGRSSSSRLTIVRIPDPNAPASGPPSADDSAGSAPSSPVSARRSFRAQPHRPRPGEGPSGDAPRLSFASATFARPGSPTLNRSAAPQLHRMGSLKTTRLSPEEVVRLAREAGRPAYAPSSSGSARNSAHNSPMASPTLPPTALPAPASFTALPDTIWLPFLDRPSEVGTLISTPPTARLFALLAQTLGGGTRAPRILPTADDDASRWTYAQLEHWLRVVDRDAADDHVWVHQARACVLPRSELIWERLKGALGVPPELDGAARAAPRPRPALPEGSAIESDPEDELVESPDEDEDHVEIEPLVAPATPPAPGMAAGDSASGLGDIGEEDEEGADDAPAAAAAPAPAPREDVVQGLRISTHPHAEDELAPAPLFASPALPAPARTGHSPSPSVLQLDAAPAPPGAARPRSYSSSSFGSAGGGYYDAASERGPGNPIFPSSFAQLALAPTLSANNPALRSPHPPPASAYKPGSRRSSITQSMAHGRRAMLGLPEGVDSSKISEYAITTASGSVRDDEH